ncbi:phosphatase PAP2 family protein [Desulfobotulus sp.]|jgi:lipid A 4'-phosphatase|uniref:phosphatase PAP2 family protein n=1 Tax=Desulfobotulus sp. TaxID=1940337 RepID=UPI002A36C5EA|nr:phosphatase PAP2 family protein [Desulfobotulus sp.]MDY0162932.1 phosphatase PAP2 family protein [Desulfobotulus sp.]
MTEDRKLGDAWFFRKRPWGLSPFFMMFFILTALFFILWSETDLWFSGLFWRPEGGFFLRSHPLVLGIYRSVEWLSYGAGAFFIFWLLGFGFFPRIRRWGGFRFAVFSLLLLALGPGLLVNAVFKDQWGRARPGQVEAFGGEAPFTPAFVPSSACERNCSFASGHASAAAWLFCLALFYPRRNPWVLGATAFYFVLAGLGRIVQGGHFLSDVIFALLLVYLVAALLAPRILMKSQSP